MKKIISNPTSIFITGASSGIGKALCDAYAKPNINLFLCGRNLERLNAIAKKCNEKQKRIRGNERENSPYSNNSFIIGIIIYFSK